MSSHCFRVSLLQGNGIARLVTISESLNAKGWRLAASGGCGGHRELPLQAAPHKILALGFLAHPAVRPTTADPPHLGQTSLLRADAVCLASNTGLDPDLDPGLVFTASAFFA